MSCPASSFIAGARTGGAAVVCGVMYREFKLLDSILAGSEQGVLLTAAEDPSTVFGLCCGDDAPLNELPIGTLAQEERRVAEGGPSRAHYTNCPLWQRECARIEVGAAAIFPRPTSRPTAADSLGMVEGVDAHGQPVLRQRAEASADFDAVDWLVED